MSIFKNETELNDYVAKLLGKNNLNEAYDESRKYKTDAERREMVRELRKVEAEEKEQREAGNTAKADKLHRRAQELIDALFYEVEMGIYKLADSLTSGPKSKRSGHSGSAYVHNTEEDLKAVGVREFLRVIEGGTYKGKSTGFNPDGRGSFMAFTMKCVEGVMKNQHTKEAKHRNVISLDAPRGDNDDEEKDTNLYNNVFADSTLRFDTVGQDQYEQFLRSDAFNVLMDCLEDVTDSQKNIDILKHYYGVDGYDQMTPTQLGEKYGVSKQRINNIVNSLIKKLKQYFAREIKNINEDADEERFLIKVGEKFTSSPAVKLTSNPNFAGVIHGRDKAEAVVAYWKSRTDDEIEIVNYEDRAKYLGESSEESVESSLNGKTLAQARKAINNIWALQDTTKCFNDECWKPVNDFFNALRKSMIKFEIVKTEYKENEDGNPSSKTWWFKFEFMNQNGKLSEINGSVIASGCGTVENPLSQYDVVFQCF